MIRLWEKVFPWSLQWDGERGDSWGTGGRAGAGPQQCLQLKCEPSWDVNRDLHPQTHTGSWVVCLGAEWKFNPALEILPCLLWVSHMPVGDTSSLWRASLGNSGFQWLMATHHFQWQASSEGWCFYDLQNEMVLFLCCLILSCTFRVALGEGWMSFGCLKGNLPIYWWYTWVFTWCLAGCGYTERLYTCWQMCFH